MSAAAFFNDPLVSSNGKVLDVVSTEDDLEALGRNADERTTRLQGYIRGYQTRRWMKSADEAVGFDIVVKCTSQNPPSLAASTSAKRSHTGRAPEPTNEGTKHPLEEPILIHDLDFGMKRIDDLPDGWTLNWSAEGHPYFTNLVDGISTGTHPLQRQANAIYGMKFNAVFTWVRHLDRGVLPEGWEMHLDQDGRPYFQNSSIPKWGWLYPRTEQSPRAADGELEIRASDTWSAPSFEQLALEDAAKHFNLLLNVTAPWWIEKPPAGETRLCLVCRHIDFRCLLHQTHPYMYENPIPLGSLQSIERKKDCSFCRLVAHTASVGIKEVGLSEIAHFSNIERLPVCCELDENPDWNRYATKLRKLFLKLIIIAPDGARHLVHRAWIQEIPTGVELPQEQYGNDCRFVKSQLDLDLLKTWLRTCERNHNSPALEPNSNIASNELSGIHDPNALIMQSCRPVPLSHNAMKLKVINVKHECIVDVTPDQRYLALSYVWGGPQHFQNMKKRENTFRENHSISINNEAIPRTIRDAMQLVRLLGERYLWVDSLCIVQDDLQQKMAQIANMGNIYSRAVLTIVAGSGDDANQGLPGVRPESRPVLQSTAQIQGMILANEQAYMHDTIEHSTWSSRAWTYQEQELSKRTFLFSDSQVYFKCCQVRVKEDSGNRNIAYRGGNALRIRSERHPIWNNYRRAVENFTKRTLTYESDMVNAFEGIMTLLRPGFRGEFLFGLPETELDIALLWQPRSIVQRRVDPATGKALFPSWSWAGWVGKVEYHWTPHLLDDLSRLKWQCAGASETQKDFLTSTEIRGLDDGTDYADRGWQYFSPQGPTRGTPHYVHEANPDLWFLHPTAPRSQRPSGPLLEIGSHELKFKALTAHFHVSPTHSNLHGDPIALCYSSGDRHILCPLDIRDRDGFVAGTVYTPGHVRLQDGPQEFICLSRRRGHHSDANFLSTYKSYRDHSYPSPAEDFLNISQKPTLYPEQVSLERALDRYDQSRYNRYKPWPLYNVMMIERVDGVAYRVANGIIHVTAFIQAKPVEKLVVLA